MEHGWALVGDCIYIDRSAVVVSGKKTAVYIVPRAGVSHYPGVMS